jgi:D-threo-aldose 1-dehydrogenase
LFEDEVFLRDEAKMAPVPNRKPAMLAIHSPNASAIKARLAAMRYGFGAASLGNLYDAVDGSTAHATLDAAWDDGVRYIDTAPFYGFGLSERRVGDALRERARDEYLLSTKVGRLLRPIAKASERNGFVSPMPFEADFDYSYDGVMRSFEHSLQRLGLSRIDILYMHDIGQLTHNGAHADLFKIAMDSGYRALDALRSSGQVGAIGLGVNEVEVCEASFAHADFDLFMLAGRYSLLDQTPLDGFFDACVARGVGIVAAGVFNSGILATGTRRDAAPYYDYQPAPQEIVTRVRRIEEVCARHHVELPAAALQFAIAHPAVLTCVVGTASPARVHDTSRLAISPLPDAFWAELREEGMIRPDAPTPTHFTGSLHSDGPPHDHR